MPVTQRNLDGYGSPPIAWPRVRELLDADLTQPPGSGGPDRHTVWLSTINADSSPHVMPVGIVEVDGIGEAALRTVADSFFTRRYRNPLTPKGCAKCTRAPQACSTSTAQYQP